MSALKMRESKPSDYLGILVTKKLFFRLCVVLFKIGSDVHVRFLSLNEITGLS